MPKGSKSFSLLLLIVSRYLVIFPNRYMIEAYKTNDNEREMSFRCHLQRKKHAQY